MPDDMKPAYLIAGGDDGKIGAALARLRSRAEREAGAGALESFSPPDGQGPPDADALIAALPAMSLIASRRYLVADGVDRWSQKQAESVATALAAAPAETTVVLIARDRPPKRLAEAVKGCGGELLLYEAPKARDLPRWVADEADARGFRLGRDAARMLVDRLGDRTARLGRELDRLALWAEPGGEVTPEDLEAMVADTSETMAWTLADAILERRAADALVAGERLVAQGAAVSYLVYMLAGRLRRGVRAVSELEAGRPAAEVQRGLGMSPYAARMLLRSVREASAVELRAALAAVADLEWWARGGSDYTDETALAIAVRRAATAGAR